MCRKFGGRLAIATDACTGKTLSRHDLVDQNSCGTRTISDGKITVDRGLNGARGYTLRRLNGNSSCSRAMGKDVALIAKQSMWRHRDISLSKKRTCKVLFLFLCRLIEQKTNIHLVQIVAFKAI